MFRGSPARHEKSIAVILLFLTSIFFLNFFSRILFSPLLPSIEKSLQLTHGEAGTIFLAISSGYFISLVGSGFISSRLGHKNTIASSIFLISVSLFLIASMSSFALLQPAFFLLGMGAGIYLPSAVATISERCTSNHWGKAFAIHELAPNMAFLAAPLYSSLFLKHFHWQQSVLIIAIVALIAGYLYHLFGEGKGLYGKPPNISLCLTILKQGNFLILVSLFALGISGTIGIFNILPLFLVTNHSLTTHDANLLVGSSRLLPLASALLGGWFADRFGNRKTIACVLLLTGLTTCCIGAVQGVSLAIFIIVQAMFAVSFFPAGFALLARLAAPSERNVVISLAIPLSFFIGGGFLPAMISLMADAGLFHVGIFITGVFIASGSSIVFFIHNNNQPEVTTGK